MNKKEYIDAITKMLQECNDEKILYYIKTFLEKMVESPI